MMEGHAMIDERYPKLKYMQQGDATCLFSSFASVLHYIGLTMTAANVPQEAHNFSAVSWNGIYNWDALWDIMNFSCPWLQPVARQAAYFDVLSDISEFPTVLALEAVDGGTQHAITIVGKLIFDSNWERALSLTKKSLDYCCSSADKEGAYHKVHRGYRFMEPEGKNKKRRKWEKLKKKNSTNFFLDDDYMIDKSHYDSGNETN